MNRLRQRLLNHDPPSQLAALLEDPGIPLALYPVELAESLGPADVDILAPDARTRFETLLDQAPFWRWRRLRRRVRTRDGTLPP